MDQSRRLLLGLPSQELKERIEYDNYFDSFESCCALLASARPFLIDEARKHKLIINSENEIEFLQQLFKNQIQPNR